VHRSRVNNCRVRVGTGKVFGNCSSVDRASREWRTMKCANYGECECDLVDDCVQSARCVTDIPVSTVLEISRNTGLRQLLVGHIIFSEPPPQSREEQHACLVANVFLGSVATYCINFRSIPG